MSVPKNFLDLMRAVGLPRAKTAFAADTGPLPDDDWVQVTIGEACNVFLEADAIANKVVLIAPDSSISASNAFHLLPDAMLVFPFAFAPGSTIHARANTTASGAHLHVFGFRPEPGSLAT